MSRTRLPNRRSQVTEIVTYVRPDGIEIRYPISLGLDDEGRVKEVFAAGAKQGTDIEFILDDACVVISIALQHGVPPEAFTKSIARIPENADETKFRPASWIGAIIEHVVRESHD